MGSSEERSVERDDTIRRFSDLWLLSLLLAGASPLVGQGRAPAPPLNTAEPVESITARGCRSTSSRTGGNGTERARFVARQERLAASLEAGAIRLSLAARSAAGVAGIRGRVATKRSSPARSGAAAITTFHRQRSQTMAIERARLWRGALSRPVPGCRSSRAATRRAAGVQDLLLAPGADLEPVVIRTAGASNMVIEADGTLMLETAAGPLRQSAPIDMGGTAGRNHATAREPLPEDRRAAIRLRGSRP